MINEYLLYLVFFVIVIIIILFYYYKNNQIEKFKFSIQDFKNTFEDSMKFINEINIPYAIVYGTALGAYRNNDFIPYDDDIDIMIFHEDLIKLGYKTLKEQQKFFNYVANKHGFEPRYDFSVPIKHVEGNKAMPIVYQYVNKKTKMPVDFYVFYKYKDNYWVFIDGGEKDFKGYKYSAKTKFFNTKLNEYDVISCPLEMIYDSYGVDCKIPKKRNEKNYYNQRREYFGDFLESWKMDLE